MATTISDSDGDGGNPQIVLKPRRKRRRILDPSAIPSVDIYTNKVDKGLEFQSLSFRQDVVPDVEDPAPLAATEIKPSAASDCIELSDSDGETRGCIPETQSGRFILRSPSPPPPSGSPQICSRRPNKKLREINRKLDAIGSLLNQSPEPLGLSVDNSQPLAGEEEDYEDSYDDDDIVVVETRQKRKVRRRPPPELHEEGRHIPIKFRYGTDIHRIPLLSTVPLKSAVEQLSIKLNVPASRLLLLRKDVELPVTATVGELDLGIADIIDCVVMSEESQRPASSDQTGGDVITVRLQSKEKGSLQEYTVGKRESLGPVLSRYTAQLPNALRWKARFMFDGSKVNPRHTPFDLDMDDGDIIEVWF